MSSAASSRSASSRSNLGTVDGKPILEVLADLGVYNDNTQSIEPNVEGKNVTSQQPLFGSKTNGSYDGLKKWFRYQIGVPSLAEIKPLTSLAGVERAENPAEVRLENAVKSWRTPAFSLEKAYSVGEFLSEDRYVGQFLSAAEAFVDGLGADFSITNSQQLMRLPNALQLSASGGKPDFGVFIHDPPVFTSDKLGVCPVAAEFKGSDSPHLHAVPQLGCYLWGALASQLIAGIPQEDAAAMGFTIAQSPPSAVFFAMYAESTLPRVSSTIRAQPYPPPSQKPTLNFTLRSVSKPLTLTDASDNDAAVLFFLRCFRHAKNIQLLLLHLKSIDRLKLIAAAEPNDDESGSDDEMDLVVEKQASEETLGEEAEEEHGRGRMRNEEKFRKNVNEWLAGIAPV
ncbi:hypothetical protein DFJ77DRAFT_439357 [Powellomyces hirtus]|nr:hypothetical protein DFJ77DRAFT_439357 [Powellomyces hirtus]